MNSAIHRPSPWIGTVASRCDRTSVRVPHPISEAWGGGLTASERHANSRGHRYPSVPNAVDLSDPFSSQQHWERTETGRRSGLSVPHPELKLRDGAPAVLKSTALPSVPHPVLRNGMGHPIVLPSGMGHPIVLPSGMGWVRSRGLCERAWAHPSAGRRSCRLPGFLWCALRGRLA